MSLPKKFRFLHYFYSVLVEWPSNRGFARCSKRLSNKAAGEANTAGVPIFHPPNPEPAETGSFPMVGYVEDVGKPRTQLGKGRVLARLG